VDSRPSNRWEDHTILQTNLHPDYNHPNLLVLRSPSKLERYDLKTGELLASLKLYKDVKFTEMAIDEDKNWLTIKSIRSTSNPSQAKKEMIMRFIILGLLPLEYKYHIVLKKSCLGVNIRDVIVSSGLIMVLRQTNEIQFFNLLPFLARASEVETSKVDGFYPNIEIQDLGPCIFTIYSYQHYLILCESQLNFLKKLSSQEFHLCSLQDSKVIGKFYSSSNVFDDQDQVHYLGDNSGRLVQTGNSSVRIFATDKKNSQTVTKEVFRYQAETMTIPKDKGPQYSRSGREIRRSIEVPPTEFTSVKLDYEDELDILGLLIVTDQLSDQEERAQTILTTIQEVRLYDGLRFNLLRVIPINFTAVRPCCDVSGLVQLCLDRDIMMIKIKGNSQTIMIPYQITETNVSSL